MIVLDKNRLNLYLYFLENLFSYINSNKLKWSICQGSELETINHVIRVLVQAQRIIDYKEYLLQLCAWQNENGGWGNKIGDISQIRATAFTVQMLLRANKELNDATIMSHIAAGLKYICDSQNSTGSWTDSSWHELDATSVSIGTLLFTINDERYANIVQSQALERAIKFIESQRHDNGLWYYKITGSPVTITSHLLPKIIAYREVDKNDMSAVISLMDMQDDAGHWDNENTDHTCDVVRAIMLLASRPIANKLYSRAIKCSSQAIDWLIKVSINGGLADKPGREPHVERTCDGIDTVLKFISFVTQKDSMISFWR